MCGIAGFVSTTPLSTPRSWEQVLSKMTGAIAHRGPDDSGFYVDEWAFLGHRRLSVIDLATGHQPMTSESSNLWITYNGEIFNHADLRPELERAGHRYFSRSDTEMILHAYEEYGANCLQRFRGMFSFALWDHQTRRLFCARDRLGIKPFYYYWDGRWFAFASEIKALLEHPAISASFDDSLLPEYLAFGYTSDDRTLFSGIRKLMPGHFLRLDLTAERPEPEIRRYWDVPAPDPNEVPRREEEWIAECRTRLEETVRLRLMSDVPLGMFLSGGVDSSAIAALMKRMVSGPVETFAVGYRETAYSELGFARQVSEVIGTEHREVTIGIEDFFNSLPRLIWQEDEPITWPSSISLYFVSKLASERVKVVLTGEGSDELFGGYDRYRHFLFNTRWMNIYRWVPAPLRRTLRAQLAGSGLLSASLRRKAMHTFLGRDNTLESLQLDNLYCAFSHYEQQRLLLNPAPSEVVYGTFRKYWGATQDSSLLRRMLYADQKTYLVELLMKQDQMSMATSIESRVPFLDHPLVEFAARVPDSLKIRGNTGKYIFKRAVADLLPHDIIYRKKMGFPTPLRDWLLDGRAEPLYALLRSGDGLLARYSNRPALDALIERHRAGVEDATDRIWRLLNLQLWGEVFLTGNRDRYWPGLLAETAVSPST